MFQIHDQWYNSENEIKRLTQGGISKELINSAIASFILQTIVKHGEPADRLCNKVNHSIQLLDFTALILFCTFI